MRADLHIHSFGESHDVRNTTMTPAAIVATAIQEHLVLISIADHNDITNVQAARRSWRIEQKLPVNVHFLGYGDTTQIGCLTLMAKKIAVSQSTSGDMPHTRLDVLNQDADSIEVALAKQLLA